MVLEYTEKVCDVHPFSESYQPLTLVPIAKVATVYDHPLTGETLILIFGQALYLGDQLEHTLICPNQAHYNNIIIDDAPIHLSHIYFPDDNIRLPLQLRGIISYIDSQFPTKHEINNCWWLIVTGDDDWQPYDESFLERELSANSHDDHVPLFDPEQEERQIYAYETDLMAQIHRSCCSLSSTARKLLTTDKTIARIFGCNPQVAMRIRQVT